MFERNDWKNFVKEKGVSWVAILIWGCLWNQYKDIYLEAFGEMQGRTV
jgi:hypothetical protein